MSVPPGCTRLRSLQLSIGWSEIERRAGASASRRPLCPTIPRKRQAEKGEVGGSRKDVEGRRNLISPPSVAIVAANEARW